MILQQAATPLIADASLELVFRLTVNVVAMVLLVFGLFHRRHEDRNLAAAAALFNVCCFAVLSVLSAVEFSVAAGFGLFAILALFSLRSEPIGRTEISYCFAAVTIALICSINGTSPGFVLLAVSGVVVGAWLVDHPALAGGGAEMKLTLDHIDQATLESPPAMVTMLSERLGVAVTGYRVIALDYPNDLAQLRVFYRRRQSA